ncbi:MAG: hypothetical protein QF755_05765 [Candidatus Peribacteraceae bacterium]|nr:hypothetical protein [Candidatus Peribacteraceae bacterium]
MQRIVDHLRTMPFIDEIIIWNNNPVSLSVSGHNVRVIQSKCNIGGYGRYLCAQHAINEVIYTQDDDWIATDIKKLYESFCSDSSKITHGLIAKHFETKEKFDRGSAQVAYMGYGAFFKKEWIKVLESYVNKFGEDNLLYKHADWMFPLLRDQRHDTLCVEAEQLLGKNGLEALWIDSEFWSDAQEAERRVSKILGKVIHREKPETNLKPIKILRMQKNPIRKYILDKSEKAGIPIIIEPEELLKYAEKIGGQIGKTQKKLYDSGQGFKKVYYEDEETPDNACLSDIVENFNELKNSLRGTAIEPMLV